MQLWNGILPVASSEFIIVRIDIPSKCHESKKKMGQYLDSCGIAVRTGHHCAWPLNRRLGVSATTRASLYLYNDSDDIDALLVGIRGAQTYFGSR